MDKTIEVSGVHVPILSAPRGDGTTTRLERAQAAPGEIQAVVSP
jgi:hypothetical protein